MNPRGEIKSVGGQEMQRSRITQKSFDVSFPVWCCLLVRRHDVDIERFGHVVAGGAIPRKDGDPELMGEELFH